MSKPNNNLLRLIAGAVLLTFFTACAPGTAEIPVTGDETPTADAGFVLSGTQWNLTGYGPAEAETPVLDGTDVNLSFEDEAQLTGSSGCNSFGAEYSITIDFEIAITNIVSTEIACSEAGVMDQERQFLDALGSASLFEYTGDTLRIWYADGQSILNFTRMNG